MSVKSYLLIVIGDEVTNIKYFVEDEQLLDYKYKFGDTDLHLEKKRFGTEEAAYIKFMSGLLYVLSVINSIDKIPTTFYLHSSHYEKYAKVLQSYGYREFTKLSPYVKVRTSDIIVDKGEVDLMSLNNSKIKSDSNLINYERYKKTVSKFKI